jgi:hypothetical protein
MVGKQGFIRTLEAVIAIILVLGFLLYILPRVPKLTDSSIPEGVDSARNYILMKFLTDNDIRRCVGSVVIPTAEKSNGFNCDKEDIYKIDDDCGSWITDLLKAHTPPGFSYSCEICDDVGPCTNLPPESMKSSVYPGAIFMYFTSAPKYVRVYFWRT